MIFIKLFGNVKLSDKLLKKVNKDEKVESPGMKYRHYAPNAECILVASCNNQIDIVNDLISKHDNCCVLGYSEDKNNINISSDRFICLGSRTNLNEISSNVFSSLRQIDKMNCSYAIIEGLEEKNLGLSIMNRLVRACENNIVW